jgi:hypothetical protein
MNKLSCFGLVGALFLLLGVTTLVAQVTTLGVQDVVFTAGPAVIPTLIGGANGGFAWGDVNGDGNLDVFIPSNNIVLNYLTSFASAASTMTVNITPNVNSVGGILADFNGDGVLDLWSTNGANPNTGLYYDSAGVFIRPLGTGDLATAGVPSNVFCGMAVADIDHSNYLSAAWSNWTGSSIPTGDNNIYRPGLGMVLLKGGPSGFTHIGKGATPANLGIDTSRTFEAWSVHFLDANNDGYRDLLMTSFRHGFSQIDLQVDSIGARKGCILYMNDGTGKFFVPTAATLGRTIYNVDSITAAGTFGRAVADTGIIVEDTVRHFNAIGSMWGDLNNDGKEDLILTGQTATNNNGHGSLVNIVVVYGKGDGTFTYKWNGTNIVDPGLPQTGSIRAWDIGDYNNDGLPDIFGSWLFSSNKVFRNNGDGTFTDVATQDYIAGGGARAGGFVDYDNNGSLDIYTYTGLVSLLQKNSGNSNHWIGFIPVGTGHNMSAIGAVFTLYTQGGIFKQIRDIRAEGNAGGGQNGHLRANFGIGINTSIDRVDVTWPDGTTGTYTGLAVDRYWTVKQGSLIPNMPSLVYPADGAVSAAAVDTLTWTAATNAIGYNVQVSMDPTFANKALLAVNATVPGTSYTYSLGAATKYYWRVAAVNNGFMSDYTTARNFTTAGVAAAAVPTVLSPTSGSTNQPASLTLKVGKTSDASRYQWQVSTEPTFATFFTNAVTADTTFAGEFNGNQTFYLRVRGMNDLGASAFSTVDIFTIMTPPGRTTLVSPANSTQNVISDSVLLVWRLVSNAASYNLQVSTVNGSTTYTGITDTTYMVRGLARLTNYTWKVEAINAGGTSYYTGTFAFTTIIAAPAVPSLVSPASAATNVNRLTRFVWNSALNAAKYRLQVALDNGFVTVVSDTVVFQDTTATLLTPLDGQSDYYWHVNAQNIGGISGFSTFKLFSTGDALGVDELVNEIPQVFDLHQNYPNPFNPSTTISFDVPKNAHVNVVIYDVLGRVVTTLVNEVKAANRYRVVWDASNVSTGVYFYRMTAQAADGSGDFNSVKKLLLMK